MTISPAFLVASLVLAITPGPGVFYIVTRSATQGRLAGLASVAGVASGNLGNALAASLGLATLFAVSAFAFTIVKYAGAIYLIYLGVRMLAAPRSIPAPAASIQTPTGDGSSRGIRSPAAAGSPPGSRSPAGAGRLYLDGLLVALFNPKTTLFFAAFMPQFLDAESATPAGTVTLGVVFVLMAATTDSLYALLAGSVGSFLTGRAAAAGAGRILSGGAFIALGVFTAVSGRHHS